MGPPPIYSSKMKNNTQFLRKIVGQLAAMGIFCTSVNAQTLATYDVEINGAATNVATDIAASTATWNGFASGAGLGGNLESAYVQSDQLNYSLHEGEYLSFTLTAKSGFLLDLQSITFDLGGSRISRSIDYTVNAVLRTDAEPTPFTTDVVLNPGKVTEAASTFNSNTPTYTTFTADLSGSNYQGLNEITFHLYVFRTSGPSSNIFLRADSFEVQGSVISKPPQAGIGFSHHSIKQRLTAINSLLNFTLNPFAYVAPL
jgi:hypothetical protein